jgi:hypothetical protein
MMRIFHKNIWPAIFLAAVSAILLSRADLHAQPPAVEPARAAPIDIVKAYLRALQARDPQTAYRHISSIDKGVRDETIYIRSQENFSGFALDLAKRLAADMEVWVIEQKLGSTKAYLEVGYRVPTGDEIASRLFGWNPDNLNGLLLTEQAVLIAAWEKVKKSGKLITIEGRETFDLVLENNSWKFFLDWRSRHRVAFKTSQPRRAELDVKFLRNDLLVKNQEPFQVDFKITNRTDRDIVVKLNHRFEPRRMEKNIDMIACGSLLPLRLRARETQEISSSYLLRGNRPARPQLAIIYDFDLLPRAEKQQLSELKEAKTK